jgi:oxygen-dependent protoporphyrinogen oxidase
MSNGWWNLFTNTAPADRPRRVVIVGGGIAGLSAAWYVQREAEKHGLALHVTLLEQSKRWGGKIQTERVDGFGDAPFVLEAGPDAFLTRKPWALALARELGLDDHILGVNQHHSRTFVVHRRRMIPLPDGLQLLVPTKLAPFLRSPLFSMWGKARMLIESFIPRRADPSDETLAQFVRRRLGAEALDKLAEPLLAGVYNADPERQSMLATFPQFPALEKTHGSLLRGIHATRAEKSADSVPMFFSFNTGTQELVNALVAQLEGDLRLNTSVSHMQILPEGGYSLTLADGKKVDADAAILAVPANVAAAMLKEAAPESANGLKAIRTASIGAVYLGFRREDVPHPLDGFGAVIPSSEERGIDGMTWVSSKWDRRAPSGHVLLRVFFGGPHTRAAMDLDDDALVNMVRGELRSLLNIQASPLFHRIFRWPDGYPQYDLGHLDRVAAIESSLPLGLYVAGSSYRGVGVPDCIKQGQAAAGQVIAQFLESRSIPQPAN